MRTRGIGLLVVVALLTLGTVLVQAAGDGSGIAGPLAVDNAPDGRPAVNGTPPDGRPGNTIGGGITTPNGRGNDGAGTDQPPAPPDTRLPGVQSSPPDNRGGGSNGPSNWQPPTPR